MGQNVLPEIVYASDIPEVSRQISALVAAGQLRALIPRVYTANFTDSNEDIVQRNVWTMLGKLFPGAVISHRSALEYRISPLGNIYLTYSYRNVYRWPGVTVRISDGPTAQDEDPKMYAGLRASSLARACLENLARSRTVEGEKRTVEQPVIEERLLTLLQSQGAQSLNKLRDEAKLLAEKFSWTKEYRKLSGLISSLLSTQPVAHLSSELVIASIHGEPYDAHRLYLFQSLTAELHRSVLPIREEKTVSPDSFRLFAFFESFFSNYIEGTTFPVDEAREIISTGIPQLQRPRDSHDILGTYEVCSDLAEMSRLPDDGDDLIAILRKRHAVIMRGRPDKNPGAFKIRANRAGNSFFVDPDKVIGTLKKGFQLMPSLPSPLARSLYMMFLISEVHPFEDGNGRVARLMMNAELTAAGQAKIIIPTVYRDDYLLNLRRLTRKHDAAAYIRMMNRAHAFSQWLEPTNYETLKKQLEQSNAFEEEGRVLLF